MKYLPTIARVLLGLMFFVFGLAGFFNFMPPPEEGSIPEKAMTFSVAMMNTGYFFQFIKGTEVICGALLLLNCFTPLALTVLAPIILNIIAFHAFLAPAPASMVTAGVIAALELYLAWCYRSSFKPMLRFKAPVG